VSIEALVSIVELQLDGTKITNLPDQIGAMQMLEKPEIKKGQHLRFLQGRLRHKQLK